MDILARDLASWRPVEPFAAPLLELPLLPLPAELLLFEVPPIGGTPDPPDPVLCLKKQN